jgi:hypothetical protein
LNGIQEVRGSIPLGSTMIPHDGAVAQLGERYLRTVEVRGSNPLGSTILYHSEDSIRFGEKPTKLIV